MSEGTYGLAIERTTKATIEVGALGDRAFPAGTYVYVGSAFGPGGFSRIERHGELANGDRDVRHWHVDYLLCDPDSTLTVVATTANADRECSIARSLPGEPIEGFGCSDCDCPTHLYRLPDDVSPDVVLGDRYDTVDERFRERTRSGRTPPD